MREVKGKVKNFGSVFFLLVPLLVLPTVHATQIISGTSLVLGGVNPPYSFLILGSFPGAVAIAILLVRRSKARNLLHSEGELPDVKVSRQRQDAAGQWWVERQLARRAAEKWPGLNEEKDHDKDKAGSEDGKGSE